MGIRLVLCIEMVQLTGRENAGFFEPPAF